MLKGLPFVKSLKYETFGEAFFDSALKYSDKLCQVDAELDHGETFKSFNERSVKVALSLQSRGITSKDVIVFCTLNTLDSAIPVVGALYAGAKVANLDPTLSKLQTKHLLGLVSPKIVFVQEDSVNLIEESLGDLESEIVVYGKSEKYATLSDFLKDYENVDKFRPVKLNPEKIAVMFFSSGTTGLPKAICHSHRSFLNIIDMFNQKGDDYSSTLAFTTFYWITGFMFFTSTFFSGGYRVINRKVEPDHFFKSIEKYKITCVFLAPILLHKLVDTDSWENYNLSSLKILYTGGTRIHPKLITKARNMFKDTTVFLAYGITECGMVAYFDLNKDKELIAKKIESCGKVFLGFIVKVVDIETEKILGPNQKGEIRIKSPTMMLGYYKNDSSDAWDEDGFLKTGDIGYYDEDSCIYVVDRIKEMFKYLSWHIVPSLLEEVIMEHPAVKEVAVYGIPVNDEIGELPAAAVVLKDGFKVDERDIEEFLAKKVADRERLRGGVKFVDNLPRTPTGKLARRIIKQAAINNQKLI